MARYSRCVGSPGEARHRTLCAISRTCTNASWTLPLRDGCCGVGMLVHPFSFLVLIIVSTRRCSAAGAGALSLLPSTDAAPDIGLGPLPVAEEHQRPGLERPTRYRDQSQGGGRGYRQQSNPYTHNQSYRCVGIERVQLQPE